MKSESLTLLENPRTQLQGFTTLTAKDIEESETLQNLKALEGDIVNPNNKLVRVASEDSDVEVVDDNVVLNEFDIANSVDLQRLDAKVGDIVTPEGRLLTKGSNDWWKNFKYNLAKESNFTGNLAAIAEANFPLGEVQFGGEDFFTYVPPSKEFMNASVEERKQMILAKKSEELARYRDELGLIPEDSLTATIAKNVADPTTLASGPLSILGKAGFFGSIAAAESVTEDVAKDQDISASKAAQQFALGATGPIVGKILPDVARSVSSKSSQTVKNLDNKKIKEVQLKVNEKISNGSSYKDAFEEAREELGMSYADVVKATASAGGKFLTQDAPSLAKKQFQNLIAHDSVVSRKISPAVNDWVLSLENAVGDISKGVKGKLQRFEGKARLRLAEYESRTAPAMKALKELPDGVRQRVDSNLFSGKFQDAIKILDEYAPKAVPAFKEVQTVMSEIADELKLDQNPDYFPRMVKDLAGLRNYLGQANTTALDKAMERAANAKGVEVGALSPIERSTVINSFLSSKQFDPNRVSGGTRNLKRRTIEEVEESMLPFYESSIDTLAMYIRNTSNAIEIQKFFGVKNARRSKEENEFRINDSIGAYVDDLLEEGAIDSDKAMALSDLLTSRFVGGEQNLGGGLGAIRDLGYIGTLTNVVSAVSNMADLALPMYKHGFKNVISSMFDVAKGRGEYNVVELGVDSIAAEFTDASKLSKLLRKLFKSPLTQYQNIDALAKESSVQAGINRARALVASDKGVDKFKERYKNIFEWDTDQLIDDLKAGRKTDLTKELAFSILSETQPITRSAMPKKWNNNPSARILYMMKSYAVRNYNLVREDIVEDFKKGNKEQAVKKAALLSGYLAATGVPITVMKDIMLNRDVDLGEIPEESMYALVGAFSVSEYSLGQFDRGQGTEAIQDYLIAPLPYLEVGLDAVTGNLSERDVQKIPVVGRLLYHWGLKGED